ncbi:MAG TPA: DUF3662 and FHA domain-containing protein [Ktedonobacterales bacterium]|nr:DUF3662 and FHA domain-containing protein [Ktedonobacterales bacterium]
MNRFESIMQGLVEGGFGKLFRTRLQTVELANKLVRAMENNLDLGPSRRTAPNVYHVHLSQRDYDYFGNAPGDVMATLQNALVMAARDRDYFLSSRPAIVFTLDNNQVTGQVHIVTQILDAHNLPNDPNAALEATRSMSPAQAAALAQQAQAQPLPRPEALPPTWLTLYKPSQGQPMKLTKPVIQIGRHLTNDVVINGKRVSRHHAQIRYEHGQWVLYDLGSTNGVGINGVLTHQPVPLKNNDRVAVGEFEFVFQRR